MAKIKQLQDVNNDENIYPITLIGAIYDDENTTLAQLLAQKQQKVELIIDEEIDNLF